MTSSITNNPLHILTLDGGGAKGFYSLGVLHELEGMLGTPLSAHFDLIFGTSTGAIIAALLALGRTVDEVHALYKQHVPALMRRRCRSTRSHQLARLAFEVFGDQTFDAFKTGIGIVATNWDNDKPLIFKANKQQAHGSKGTFVPGFGATIADAVIASCSAYPFFKRHAFQIPSGSTLNLADGGYCANNPTLYAIADATMALKHELSDMRLVSIGVGEYPEPRYPLIQRCIRRLPSLRLLQKTLAVNTASMDQLRFILFRSIPSVRISDAYTSPDLATDLLESNIHKLNLLYNRGRESFRAHESTLTSLLSSKGRQ